MSETSFRSSFRPLWTPCTSAAKTQASRYEEREKYLCGTNLVFILQEERRRHCSNIAKHFFFLVDLSGSTFQMPDRMCLTRPTSLTLFAATTRLNSLQDQLMQKDPRSRSPGAAFPTRPSIKTAISDMSTASCSERFPTSKAKSCSRDQVKAISRYIAHCLVHDTTSVAKYMRHP